MLTTTLKSIGYDRLTKDFRAEYDGNVIGYFSCYSDAEEALNDYVLGLCQDGLIDQPLAALVPEGTDEDDFSDVPAGPGEPRADSAVRAHLTYGHLRRDLFAPVFFCACGARASIVVYGNPDVMRCDACHTAGPACHTAGPAYHAPGYCANCGGPHATQRCPEIAQALHTPDAGAAIARQFHRDRARFLATLRNLDTDAWQLLAAAYCAYMARIGTWIKPAHIIRVWSKAVEGDIALPARAHLWLVEGDASAESYAGMTKAHS